MPASPLRHSRTPPHSLALFQILIWAGLIVSPAIAVLGVLVQLVDFHLNHYLVMRLSRQPDRPITATRIQLFFLVFLSLTYLIALLPLSIFFQLGTTCGLDATASGSTPKYQTITKYIKRSPVWVVDFLSYITDPAFLLPVILLLAITLYYREIVIALLRQRVGRLEKDLNQEHLENVELMREMHAESQGKGSFVVKRLGSSQNVLEESKV